MKIKIENIEFDFSPDEIGMKQDEQSRQQSAPNYTDFNVLLRSSVMEEIVNDIKMKVELSVFDHDYIKSVLRKRLNNIVLTAYTKDWTIQSPQTLFTLVDSKKD